MVVPVSRQARCAVRVYRSRKKFRRMNPRPENFEVFRAIASPTRRALLDKLSNREQTVQRLAASLQMTVPAISQQLTVLRKAGLVTVRRAGRWRVYRLNAEPLREVMAWAQP